MNPHGNHPFSDQPMVSLILVVRNGMPLLSQAMESIAALSYRNYELVVQDGASTDGTVEFLRTVRGIPSVSLVSEPDSGIGQAYNRAVRRCRGDVIASIDSDNLLYQNALETILGRLSEHPDAAIIYTGCDMVHGDGTFSHRWMPPAFDLLGLLDGSVVPPFGTSFFARRMCGEALAFDETLTTVADFDLWLRLSHLKIVRTFDVLGAVRMSDRSSTWNADNYTRMVMLKIAALRRFLGDTTPGSVLDQLRLRSESGIYLWALDSMAMIDAEQHHRDRFFSGTHNADLRSLRFRDAIARARPHVDPDDRAFVAALTASAEEYVLNGMPSLALPYLTLLQASGCLRLDLQAALPSPEDAPAPVVPDQAG
jgi:glycosyltransferase involved in cell wall biosynthesis